MFSRRRCHERKGFRIRRRPPLPQRRGDIAVHLAAGSGGRGQIQLGKRLWCTTNFAGTVSGKWFVYRHRELVAGPFETELQAMHGVHRLQPQSAEWAIKHDGYSIDRDIDAGLLRQIVSSIVSEYLAGAYAVPKRADEYGEADAGFACYLVKPGAGLVDERAAPAEGEVKVWAIGDREGLHIMLPEDH